MRIAVIDIETTGLEPQEDHILAVGCVLMDTEDTSQAVWDLPSFFKIFKWSRVSGNPFALWLNRDLLQIIADGKDKNLIDPEKFDSALREFLVDNGYDPNSVIVGGKNVAGFDIPFLKNYLETVGFNHRTVDPAMFFIRRGDIKPPDLKTCLARCGIIKEVAHTALQDCYDVAQCIRAGMTEKSL